MPQPRQKKPVKKAVMWLKLEWLKLAYTVKIEECFHENCVWDKTLSLTTALTEQTDGLSVSCN